MAAVAKAVLDHPTKTMMCKKGSDVPRVNAFSVKANKSAVRFSREKMLTDTLLNNISLSCCGIQNCENLTMHKKGRRCPSRPNIRL